MEFARLTARRLAFVALCFAFAASSGVARAFPGICVGRDDAARYVHTTELVLMRKQRTSVLTLMADYEGPLAPFAFILPVPGDVVAQRVKTVKRAILHRLEQLSAPRFHAFYEQDPCVSGAPEQDWEEHVKAAGAGLLDMPDLPVLEPYALPNLISAPVTPVFKGVESEFNYSVLEPSDVAQLGAWLDQRRYRISEPALSALAPYIGRGKKLLIAEVAALENVEMLAPNRIELGGIRYWSEQPLSAFPVTLGLQNADTTQDLTIYVLDPEQRLQAKNYDNAYVPSNLEVDAGAAERIAPLYNALFDRVSQHRPQSFVTEFAWSSAGCGEPCPDAPLGLDELMTLGGDVMEARSKPASVSPAPASERALERRHFEQQLAELPPGQRAEARREHARSLRELERRRALGARQTYVLSRLHYRYTRSSLPRDIELGPAPAIAAGVGLPKGPSGELPHATTPARQNQLQVRFLAFHPWKAELRCSVQFHFRWGKRWASEARASHAVPLGMDLALAAREPSALTRFLKTELPELGILPDTLSDSRVSPSRALATSARAPNAQPASQVKSGRCSVGVPGALGSSRSLGALGFALLALVAQSARRISASQARDRTRCGVRARPRGSSARSRNESRAPTA